jgi:broad specificity phosphatase PhoE
MKLFVFRHGETDWNKQKRFQGHTDIPLNSEGHAQAEALSEKLLEYEIQCILSSDLIRAKETAEAYLRKKRIPFHVDPRLRECFLGEAEGLTREDIAQRFGAEAIENWFSLEEKTRNFKFPDGESRGEHLDRLQKGILDFCSQNSHWEDIAISTHGGSLRRLVHSCEEAPLEPIPIINCSLYLVELDLQQGRWIYRSRLR